MNPEVLPELVHSHLARWAIERADTIAVDDGQTRLSFADLHAAVQQVAETLQRSRAPATVLVDDRLPIQRRVIDFLGAIASGRCAAVSDPDWTDATRQAVLASLDTSPASPVPPGPTTPFYIGFTSGSTGLPKGFRRHHRSWTESFRVCADTFGPDTCARMLVPGRFSHSLFLFGVMLGLWSGAGVVVQERFSAPGMIETLARCDTPCLVAVPSQLLVLLELAERRQLAPMVGVKLIMISGARWMREQTPTLQALFPCAQIIEFYGASETSFITWMHADATVPPQVVGEPFANVELDIRDPSPGDGTGLIYVRSPMVFMDYAGGGGDATAALRDGDWLSVRDVGRLDDQGRLLLMGRQNRMIVTQGKNLFPEELETVLAASPWIAVASVHGLPHPVRGQQVVAVVQPRPGMAQVAASVLTAWCRERLEAYKVPRRFVVCDDWPWTASGKTDHHALGQQLLQMTDLLSGEATQCLRPLH